jgi:hypothetical protein
MKLLPHEFSRRQGGMVAIVTIIVLTGMLLAFIGANATALSSLQRELASIERHQLKKFSQP